MSFQKILTFTLPLFQQVATPTVVKKILRLKYDHPGMFAWEIRETLAQQKICDPSALPSVSSINRILRNSGMWSPHPDAQFGHHSLSHPDLHQGNGTNNTHQNHPHQHAIPQHPYHQLATNHHVAMTTPSAVCAATVAAAAAVASSSAGLSAGKTFLF